MGQTASSPSPAQCPIAHDAPPAPAACPVAHDDAPAECPIAHQDLSARNHMPALPQTPDAGQARALPTARAASSIPRGGAGGGVWEYPSPQQFFNALVRKGAATREEEAHAETMVALHNFLNEQAWEEVLRWERMQDSAPEVELTRFKGRPGELSPKARLFLLAGWLLPARFNTEPPFDRHDWVVRRRRTGEEVRYVIDYYSAPPTPDGAPVFSLDVRPALDSVGSVRARVVAATQDAWAALREREQGGVHPSASDVRQET